MKSFALIVLIALAVPAGASTKTDDPPAGAARTCPALGEAGSVMVGAAVGGLGGAIWADADHDGCADGYVREGRYYKGAPVVQPLPAGYGNGEGR